MTRIMLDTIGADAAKLPGAPIVAGYITGGPGIVWTAADWGRFHGTAVPIDQSNETAPYLEHRVLVLDVERGAKTLQHAVIQAQARAGHKLISTVYVAASNYSLAVRTVAAAGLTGSVDYWVANWSLSRAEAAALLAGHVVAVQCESPTTNAGSPVPGSRFTIGELNCDLSVVTEFWPAPRPSAPVPAAPKAPKVPKPHPKVTGSAAGALLGIALTAVLHAAGVHVTPAEAGAISTLTGAITGTVTPAPS